MGNRRACDAGVARCAAAAPVVEDRGAAVDVGRALPDDAPGLLVREVAGDDAEAPDAIRRLATDASTSVRRAERRNDRGERFMGRIREP